MEKTLKEALAELQKANGAGSIYKVAEATPIQIERTSYGVPTMDDISGGGCPNGRVIEVFGGESSGKTTLAILAAIEHQKRGIVAYIDYEHAFDMDYAKALGLDTDNLVFSQPFSAEEGLDAIDKLAQTKEISLIVVDSVAAMAPKKELEGESGESVMGVHARLMSQALRKLVGKASANGVTVLFLNQTREKIGVMFGSPLALPGGNALKFYASQRFQLFSTKEAEDGNSKEVRVKNIKNKVAIPHKKGSFNIEFGKGVDILGDIIRLAVEKGIISKSGSWYSYGEVKLGQGSNGAKELLSDNPELVEEIKKKLVE